jgi:hypothetical protein
MKCQNYLIRLCAFQIIRQFYMNEIQFLRSETKYLLIEL